MKHLIFFSSFLLLLLSCSKDSENDSTLGSGNLTMKINGVLWTSSSETYMIDTETENAVLNAVNINEQESFGFVIEDFTGVGKYPTSQGANFTGAFYTRKDKKIFSAGSELQYNVTQIDGTKFHGTFSGTVKNTDGEILTITEGKF